MEAPQQQQYGAISPHDGTLDALRNNEDDVFHKSRRVRILLNIGNVIQACVVLVTLIASIGDEMRYRETFVSIAICLLAIVYLIFFFYASLIWFLSSFWNKPLPTTRWFVIAELVKSIPCLIIAVIVVLWYCVFLVAALISNPRFYWDAVVLTVIGAIFYLLLASTSIWMWIYFIRNRKEEIVAVLWAGQQAQPDVEEQQAPAAMATGNESVTDEDAPLLIDRMV